MSPRDPKRMVRRIACAAGLDRLARRRSRPHLAIFCYHSVAPDGDATRDWLVVGRSAFEQQMAFVREHFTCLPLSRGVDDLLNGRLQAPTACVTFDDGYSNNLTVALPILSKLEIPATVFLATGFIGTGRSLWTTRLIYGLSAGSRRTLPLDVFGIPPLVVGEGRSEAVRGFVERLKEWPAPRRRKALERIDAELSSPVLPAAFEFLNWPQVRCLAESPWIAIGAHTVNHEILSRIGDRELRAEITGAGDDIESHTGLRPVEFAFPNGRAQDFDRRSAAILADAGFRVAVTTLPGLNDRAADPLMMRRVLVGGEDDLDTFRLAASGITGMRTLARALGGHV